MRLNQRVAGLRPACGRTLTTPHTALAAAPRFAGATHALRSLPLCSAPAPLARAVCGVVIRPHTSPLTGVGSTYANPCCAGVSSGVRPQFARSASAGEGREAPSQTLPRAALSRGLAARWVGSFARIS